MIRTQIQLTEEQAQALKKLAAAEGRSIADVVRDGVDHVLRQSAADSRRDRMLRAASVFGKFRSGMKDLATRHDDEFAEDASRRR